MPRVLNEATVQSIVSAVRQHQGDSSYSPASKLLHRPTQTRVSNTVLIAEDDPDTRGLVDQVLTNAGYRTLVAEDGDQVFRILEHEVPGLFLLDCVMPGLDGFTVCERLRIDARYAEIPVIFFTALSEGTHVARGFQVGGSDYVCKPLEKTELLARVGNLLELSTSRRLLKQRALLLEGIVEAQGYRLEEVRQGQSRLLQEQVALPGVEVAARLQSAHEAGGDFYEAAQLGENSHGFLVADVSGHDLSVPYITGGLKALSSTFLSEGLSCQESMMLMNASLRNFLSPEYYVTACYAKYARDRMEVEILNAGHPPALYQGWDGRLEYIDLVGDILGMHDDVRFRSRTFPVKAGERLYLYSDGLIEGYPDDTGQAGRCLWGMEQFRGSLAAKAGMPITETVEAVIDELLVARGGRLEDDVVLLGVEFQ